jgi:L-threonylcarbamoyladenylate synthase
MAHIVAIDPVAPDLDIIHEAASIIRSGGLVVIPTETVYGLGADATDPAAVRRIFEAKGRPQTNPLIVHCESVTRIRNECVSEWPEVADKLATAFWPGPLTLILPKLARIPFETTAGLPFVGVRIPANEVTRALIAAADRPIAAPSANRSNRLSPTQAEHVANDLGDRVGWILDAGPCSAGVESTVLDLSSPEPRILRPGPIRAAAIEEIIGKKVLAVDKVEPEESSRVSPGQSRLHYSPRKPLKILNSGQHSTEPSTAWLILGIRPGDSSQNLIESKFTTANDAERSLYDTLHRWDDDPRILTIHVYFGAGTESPDWAAIRDRLTRAACRVD